MPKTKVRIDSVPEGVQAIVAAAAADLVEHHGLDPDIIRVTKLEQIERLDTEDETPIYGAVGQATRPDYRILFLAKGVQYVYETQRGRSPELTEEAFVV